MHLDVDATGEQRLHELERESAVSQVQRFAAVGDHHYPVLHLELDVTVRAAGVRERDERDRVGGRDLEPVPVESRRGGPVEEFLELHEEVADQRRNRHAVDLSVSIRRSRSSRIVAANLAGRRESVDVYIVSRTASGGDSGRRHGQMDGLVQELGAAVVDRGIRCSRGARSATAGRFHARRLLH